MTVQIQPMADLTQRVTEVLVREVGVVDTIRFLNQFRAGSGNYTEERGQLLKGMSVKDIVNEIKSQRS